MQFYVVTTPKVIEECKRVQSSFNVTFKRAVTRQSANYSKYYHKRESNTNDGFLIGTTLTHQQVERRVVSRDPSYEDQYSASDMGINRLKTYIGMSQYDQPTDEELSRR